MNVKDKSENSVLERALYRAEQFADFCERCPELGRYFFGVGRCPKEEDCEPQGSIVLSQHGGGLCVTLIPHGSTTCGFCDIPVTKNGLDLEIEAAIIAGNFVWRNRRYIRPACGSR